MHLEQVRAPKIFITDDLLIIRLNVRLDDQAEFSISPNTAA